MKLSIALALLLLAAAPAYAQVEVIQNPMTPADAKPNDPSVPDAYALTGQFDRIVVLRMKNKVDLLRGIEEMVKAQGIKNGVILAGIGSLRGYHVHQINNRDFPTRNVFTKALTTPCDLVGMNGYVVNGVVHAHMMLGTGEKAINGHLEPGTEVFTYAIVTIGVMNNTDLSRIDDKSYR
ncbi:MAG: DNA-binding protein [Alphaproteobacteria bacterium]|nr:DNA-binding protein [Alphaproteobacteria bacterium]